MRSTRSSHLICIVVISFFGSISWLWKLVYIKNKKRHSAFRCRILPSRKTFCRYNFLLFFFLSSLSLTLSLPSTTNFEHMMKKVLISFSGLFMMSVKGWSKLMRSSPCVDCVENNRLNVFPCYLSCFPIAYYFLVIFLSLFPPPSLFGGMREREVVPHCTGKKTEDLRRFSRQRQSQNNKQIGSFRRR